MTERKVVVFTVPTCIGGLDAESDWCNKECPEPWLHECLDRIIEKMAPVCAREILTIFWLRNRVKAFGWECRIKAKGGTKP